MSWSGAIPHETDQSDSRILIDACLERVRKDAGLDDESVLPPLDVLIGRFDRTSPPQNELSARRGPYAVENAELAVSRLGLEPRRPEVASKPLAELGDQPAASSSPARSEVEAVDARQPTSSVGHRLRWPVVLCGFIGFLFGGMALMRSPAGQGPAVQQVMTTAADHVGAAYGAPLAVKTSLTNR